MNTMKKLSLNELPVQTGPIALMLLMAATRFHHFGTGLSLPDASLAVFFLAGLWSGGISFFMILLLEAGLIDYLAIGQFGVSDYCISPAYVFLVPTYTVLWFGGKLCAKFKAISPSALMQQFGILALATSIAFLISNGSFYLLSGRFGKLSVLEYVDRVAQYYPAYLSAALIYVVVITAVVALVKLLPASTHNQKTV